MHRTLTIPFLTALFLMLGVCSFARAEDTVRLNKLWSIEGITAEPKNGLVCGNRTRLFVHMHSVGKGSMQHSDFLMLYDLTNGRFIRTFGKSFAAAGTPDSHALVWQGGNITRVRVADGVVVDNITTGTVHVLSILSPGLDTIAVTHGNAAHIIDIRTGDTLGSGHFPNSVTSIQRIPGTDSVSVTYTYANLGKNPVFDGGVMFCAQNNLGKGIEFFDKYCSSQVIGNKLIRISGNFDGSAAFIYERQSRAKAKVQDASLFAQAGGGYGAFRYDSRLHLVYFSPELDSIFGVDIDADPSAPYVTWYESDSVFCVATDSRITRVHRVDNTTFEVSRTAGPPLPSGITYPKYLHTPGIVSYRGDSGVLVTDFLKNTTSNPFVIDGRVITELRPASTPHRLAFGAMVREMDQRGAAVDSTFWPLPKGAYAYATDTWYTMPTMSQYYGQRTFDSVATIRRMIHDRSLVDAWAANDGASYFTADVSGRINQWDISTQKFLRSVRNPASAEERQLYTVKHVHDSLHAFVERRTNGRLTWGLARNGFETVEIELSTDSLSWIGLSGFTAISLTGPTRNGSYIIKHPSIDTLFIVTETHQIQRFPFRPLKGIIALNVRDEVVAIDSSQLYILDPVTMVIRDSMTPYLGGLLYALEASESPNHVLINAYTSKGHYAARFNLVARDLDARTLTSMFSGRSVSMGDGRTIMTIPPYVNDLQRLHAVDITTLDTVEVDRWTQWISADAYPSWPMRLEMVVSMSMSADRNTFVMFLSGSPNTVLTQTRTSSNIHYYYNMFENNIKLVLHQNGNLIECRGPSVSTIHNADFTPIAIVNSATGSLHVSDPPTDRFVFVGDQENASALTPLEFPRPIGEPGKWDNILQLGRNYKHQTAKTVIAIGDNTRRFLMRTVDGLIIATVDGGYPLDTLTLPESVASYTISADRRILCLAGIRSLYFYDMKYVRPIGTCAQFNTIESVTWSHTGHRLYIRHDYAHFGLYDFADIPLGILEERTTSIPSACSCSMYLEGTTLRVLNAHTSDVAVDNSSPVKLHVFNSHGELVASAECRNEMAVSISLANLPTQMLYVQRGQGALSCTHTIPLIR